MVDAYGNRWLAQTCRGTAGRRPESLSNELTWKVSDAIWKRFFTISEPQFEPFVWEVVYWIEMPALPPDVKFKYRLYLKDFQVIYK